MQEYLLSEESLLRSGKKSYTLETELVIVVMLCTVYGDDDKYMLLVMLLIILMIDYDNNVDAAWATAHDDDVGDDGCENDDICKNKDQTVKHNLNHALMGQQYNVLNYYYMNDYFGYAI